MEAFVVFVKGLFDGVWSLYAAPVPGFGFSFGALALAVLLIEVAVSIICFIFGIKAGGVRGGNNRKIKISRDRRGDTK